MIWLVVLIVVGVLIVMGFAGRQQVSWATQLRRINAGVAYHAEWMAPDVVAMRVKADYLEAMQWLKSSQIMPWDIQWLGVTQYFSGLQLKRHQEILKHYRIGRTPQYLGILECDHHVVVRHFSEDGERCIVIDSQSNRSMLTYRLKKVSEHIVQELEPATLVYEMVYDLQLRRWKVDRFIQQLPTGWQHKTQHIRLSSALPPSTGRDS